MACRLVDSNLLLKKIPHYPRKATKLTIVTCSAIITNWFNQIWLCNRTENRNTRDIFYLYIYTDYSVLQQLMLSWNVTTRGTIRLTAPAAVTTVGLKWLVTFLCVGIESYYCVRSGERHWFEGKFFAHARWCHMGLVGLFNMNKHDEIMQYTLER